MVSTLERRIFPADDLSDIALAVTVEPQVIGAILYDFPSWWNPGRTTLVVYVGPAGRSAQSKLAIDVIEAAEVLPRSYRKCGNCSD